MLRYMILHHVGFPIRKSVDQCLFAAPHSLSQLVTSFIGSWCQGIHLTLLFAWTSCIFPILGSLWIVWVSWTFSFRIYIDSSRCEKTFFSPFALAFELRFRAFHLAVKLYFPFRLERLNNLLFLSSSVRFLLKNLFLLFDCQRSFAFAFANASSFLRKEETCRTRFSEFCGRSGWTRTIDLALIRRAL